jgi:hypothetical protein
LEQGVKILGKSSLGLLTFFQRTSQSQTKIVVVVVEEEELVPKMQDSVQQHPS